MKITSQSIKYIFIILVVAVFSLLFYITTTNATSSYPAGSLSVRFNPNAGIGSEFVSLSFVGYYEQSVPPDLNGWWLTSETGLQYDLSNITLDSSNDVKICEAGANDPGCHYYWAGNDVFNDAGDELRIVSNDELVVLSISYQTTTAGQIFTGSGEYVAEFYSSGEKISVCQTDKKGKVRYREINVNNFINNGKDPVEGLPTDVVPAFLYETKKVKGYYPGIHWPELKDNLENNCE